MRLAENTGGGETGRASNLRSATEIGRPEEGRVCSPRQQAGEGQFRIGDGHRPPLPALKLMPGLAAEFFAMLCRRKCLKFPTIPNYSQQFPTIPNYFKWVSNVER